MDNLGKLSFVLEMKEMKYILFQSTSKEKREQGLPPRDCFLLPLSLKVSIYQLDIQQCEISCEAEVMLKYRARPFAL